MKEDKRTRVTVNILDEEYVIRGDVSTECMQEVASYVHGMMQKLAEHNPHISRHKLAVLTAINLADEVLRLKARLKTDSDINSFSFLEREGGEK